MIDALFAIGIIAILTVALTQSVTQQRRAQERLAASRSAVRLAEQALVALQAGQPAPAPPQGTTLEVRPAPEARAAPAGWRWVTVHVRHAGRIGELTGLAPAGGAP